MTKFWLSLEVAIIFILLMCRIWLWTNLQFLAAIPILLVAVSWYFRGDTLKTLGINPEWPSKKLGLAMFLSFAVLWLITLVCGLIWNPNLLDQATHGVFWCKYAKMSFSYFFWALLQQLWLCGYFASRIQAVLNDNRKTVVITGVLFAIVHFPNPVLTLITFFGGMLSAYFFLRVKNLYALALAHGILGPSIRLFLDYTLRIGPRFFS